MLYCTPAVRLTRQAGRPCAQDTEYKLMANGLAAGCLSGDMGKQARGGPGGWGKVCCIRKDVCVLVAGTHASSPGGRARAAHATCRRARHLVMHGQRPAPTDSPEQLCASLSK
jgi:hypothetical protein